MGIHSHRTALILIASALLLTPQALASQVRPLDLEQMTERAARIFAGRCTETRVVYDAAVGGRVTLATFEVERAVKGVNNHTITVRMLGEAAGAGSPAGVPAFRAGEEVVLFLYGENASGLSSPVGLGQGRFKVVADKRGRRLALNEFGNRSLLAGVRPEIRARLRPEEAEPSRAEARRLHEPLDPTLLLDTVETLLVEPNRIKSKKHLDR